jgi:hypothetical protein
LKIDAALQNITRLFLDPAPIIYYVEKNPQYFATVEFVFDEIDSGSDPQHNSESTPRKYKLLPG